MLEPLSPAFAIGGGLLIGGAAALLLMLTGRIAGVSGMFATMVRIADAALSCLLGAKGSPVSAGIPIEIITRENLMHR